MKRMGKSGCARASRAVKIFLAYASVFFLTICAGCENIVGTDFYFDNQTDYDIEYKIGRYGSNGTIKAHESYTRYLVKDLDVSVSSNHPVYCVSSSDSAVFHEIEKNHFTLKNNCAFSVTLDYDDPYLQSRPIPVRAGSSMNVDTYADDFFINDYNIEITRRVDGADFSLYECSVTDTDNGNVSKAKIILRKDGTSVELSEQI